MTLEALEQKYIKHLPGIHNQDKHAGRNKKVQAPVLPASNPANTVTFYHGSVAELTDKILKEGIKPAENLSESEIATLGWQDLLSGDRKKSVFLATTPGEARQWGTTAVMTKMGLFNSQEISESVIRAVKNRVVVFEVELDPDVLKKDEIIPNAKKHLGPIKPEQIKGYRIYEMSNREDPSDEEDEPIEWKAGFKKFYVPFVVVEPLAKHLPGIHNQQNHAGLANTWVSGGQRDVGWKSVV